MKIAPYIERLNSSIKYKDFQKKYSDAFMMAGFFILDLELGKNMHQIDYYVPSSKKIAAFNLDGGISMQLLDGATNKVPEKLDIKTQIDLDAIPGILQDEMKNRSITEDIKKIIAILQNIDGKKVWNLNCVLSGMSILRAHVDDNSKTVLRMEKVSMMDYMKRVPASALQQVQQSQEGEQMPKSKKEVEEAMDKLGKLSEQIEKEKEILKKQLEKEKTDFVKEIKSSNSKKAPKKK